MRRILFLLVVFVGLVAPTWAATKIETVTVAELGQWLAGIHGQSDGKIAKELQSIVLTERVDAAQLTQWQSALPGPRSRDALTAMADVSILFTPPAAEVLPDPSPDLKAQGAILSHAIDYVVQTLARLPDFYATRATEHFEDNPARQGIAHITQNTNIRQNPTGLDIGFANPGIPTITYQNFPYSPLHRTGESSVPVSYRDGAEMRGAERMDRAAINRPESGLATAGEFGPILSVVVDDAMHGSVEWAYWQQRPLGKLAVFHYTVAEGHSNYVLALKHGIHEERLFPAYHGEIAIDPATGAILRITLVGGSLRSQDVMESAIAVDYGSVALGGKNYICPLKGIALLRTVVDTPGGTGLQTQVNDTTFTAYHVMRADITILPAQQ
jgi:hypothetical protein